MVNRFTPKKFGDYVFDCQICGNRCYASEVKSLDAYTGRGGILACKECQDQIHYGFVPYTVRAERPVPIANDLNYTANPSQIPQPYPVIDYAVFPPGAISPDEWAAFFMSWDQMTSPMMSWDRLNYPYNWSSTYTDLLNILQTNNGGTLPIDEDGDYPFPEFPDGHTSP